MDNTNKDEAVIAREYAKHYNISPQNDGEDDIIFRKRVSGVLRDMGKIIEAHEAFNDKRYEDGGDVVTGIVGALTQAIQGGDYGRHGENQVADDFASGIVSQSPKEELSPAEILMMLILEDAQK